MSGNCEPPLTDQPGNGLDDWLVYIEQIHPVGWDLGLDRVRKVAERLDVLKPAPVTLLVAGTNGKGSTCEYLEAYAAADHVSFELGNVPGFKQAWIPRLLELGINPKIFATTYDGYMVSHYLRGTDLIATMASRSATVFAGSDLVLRDIPLDIDVEVNMYWTAAADRAPLNSWLRQVITDVARTLGAPTTNSLQA